MSPEVRASILKRVDKLTRRIEKDLKELGKLRWELTHDSVYSNKKSKKSKGQHIEQDIEKDGILYDAKTGDPNIHVEGKPDINLYTGEEVRVGRRRK